MTLIWAICKKSGQKPSRIGRKRFNHHYIMQSTQQETLSKRPARHYMAFAKTPKWRKLAVKYELKHQVLKTFVNFRQQKFAISCPTLQPGRTFPTTLTNKPNTGNAIFTGIWNHFVLQNCELSFPYGQNSISRYFFSQNPKCRFFCFICKYTNVHLCAKFGDLKLTINEKQGAQIWTCFWARCRNNIPQGSCNFLSKKCLINVNQSSQSADCAA